MRPGLALSAAVAAAAYAFHSWSARGSARSNALRCLLAAAASAAASALALRLMFDDLRAFPRGWQQLLRSVAAGELPLVDTRPADQYAARHLRGSTSLPLSELQDRTGELPPPPCDLVVLASAGEEAAALWRFEGSRWCVVEVLTASNELWDEVDRLGLTCTGAASRRLWASSPHLPQVIGEVERLCVAQDGGGSGDGEALGLRALDLGCGRGRDAVFLASRGWEVSRALLNPTREPATTANLARLVQWAWTNLGMGPNSSCCSQTQAPS
jgi:hypothetical protein